MLRYPMFYEPHGNYKPGSFMARFCAVCEALCGLLIVWFFSFWFFGLALAQDNLKPCQEGAKFIVLISEGRSPPAKSDFEKLLVRFVKSDFGRRFSSLEHYQSFAEMCVYFEGSEPKMAKFLRNLLKEVQT